MAIFTVHLPPQNETGDAPERARFTLEGGSKLALFLPPVFLAFHRLWHAFAVYCLSAAIAVGVGDLGYPAIGALALAIASLFMFLEGNELVRRALEENGWRLAAIVAGENREEAELRYFAAIGPAPSLPLAARPSDRALPDTDDRPSIGIFSE